MHDDADERDFAGDRLHEPVPAGPALLRHLADEARGVTGAARAYLVHRLADPTRVEVLAGSGAGAPAAGMRMATPVPSPPDLLVIPVSAGSTLLGSIVTEGVPEPLAASAPRQLALLGIAGGLALQNDMLIRGAERRGLEVLRQQYHLVSGTIYHLKNALGGASEYLELLELEEELKPAQKGYADGSRRSIAVAVRLLTELHDLGLAESGELVPQREPINLGLMLRDLVRDYRLAVGTTTVLFVVDVDELPLVSTDPDCVRQILDTLISNAARYSPADGVVTVRASCVRGRRSDDPARWVRIDIADMGPGVTEQDNVFEEVQRVAHKGAPGFRLAIARRLARLLGGDIVLATAAGAGSTFSLWLPAEP
jgi:signal transduction histidine kinase